jgi:hypothetical protein
MTDRLFLPGCGCVGVHLHSVPEPGQLVHLDWLGWVTDRVGCGRPPMTVHDLAMPDRLGAPASHKTRDIKKMYGRRVKNRPKGQFDSPLKFHS